MDTISVISGLMNDYRYQLPDQRATLIYCSTRVLKSNLIVNALPWLPESWTNPWRNGGYTEIHFARKGGCKPTRHEELKAAKYVNLILS